MCRLILSAETKAGWKEKSNTKTVSFFFFPVQSTGEFKLILPACHKETRFSCNFFPVRFGLGFTFKAIGLGER